VYDRGRLSIIFRVPVITPLEIEKRAGLFDLSVLLRSASRRVGPKPSLVIVEKKRDNVAQFFSISGIGRFCGIRAAGTKDPLPLSFTKLRISVALAIMPGRTPIQKVKLEVDTYTSCDHNKPLYFNNLGDSRMLSSGAADGL
jgi:hypothetical protein